MPDLGKELSSLDFANLIGGPLNAIVDAQGRSAIATANFVQQVGFDKEGAVRNTTFRYSKPNKDGDQEEFALTVPFISMLPIPFIKIDEGEVEFNAKLTSTQETSNSSTICASASVDATVNYWFVKARIKASASYKKTVSATEKVERTYEMRVKVVVRGTDLPQGMERLMGMLENAMDEAPTGKLTGNITLGDALKAGDTSFDVPDGVTLEANDIVTFPAYTDPTTNKPVDAEDHTVSAFKAAVPGTSQGQATIDALKADQASGTTVTWKRKRV